MYFILINRGDKKRGGIHRPATPVIAAGGFSLVTHAHRPAPFRFVQEYFRENHFFLVTFSQNALAKPQERMSSLGADTLCFSTCILSRIA